MDDLERYRLESWIALAVWLVASWFVLAPMLRANWGRKPGAFPFLMGNFAIGIGDVAAAIIYVWILYHPDTWIGRWAIDLILGFLIFRGIGFLAIGFWVRHR